KYALFRMICAPCIWGFLLSHPQNDFLRVYHFFISRIFLPSRILVSSLAGLHRFLSGFLC
ncbi:MAG: hypothetical protein BWK76_14845, partial [Desulfobulbaceae bacterium A2]